MITAERKPIQEIMEYVKPYGRILLLGCNECVTVCAAGGMGHAMVVERAA